jgi:hypothetical protein
LGSRVGKSCADPDKTETAVTTNEIPTREFNVLT